MLHINVYSIDNILYHPWSDSFKPLFCFQGSPALHLKIGSEMDSSTFFVVEKWEKHNKQKIKITYKKKHFFVRFRQLLRHLCRKTQNVMKKFLIILMATGAMLLTGCVAVTMQKPTVKNYRKVLAMDNLTPITVEQLRQMIAVDTTHYKVVVLTSSCCGPCEIAMRDTYPGKMAECDTSQVRWYFVETDYSTAQYMDKVFMTYHINSPRYWINDTLPQYRPLMVKNMWTVVWNMIWNYGKSFEELGWEEADNRLNNIVNTIAPQSQSITGPNGTPTTVMLNPHNQMKCTYTIDGSGNATLEPTDIRNITVPVTALDYSRVDTLSYARGICTPDGRCY